MQIIKTPCKHNKQRKKLAKYKKMPQYLKEQASSTSPRCIKKKNIKPKAEQKEQTRKTQNRHSVVQKTSQRSKGTSKALASL